MTLAHLDRHEEARQPLNRLRVICAKGDTADESCLYEAEKVLAAQDSTLVSIWQFIQDGQPNQALDLLKDRGATPVTPIQAEAMQAVGQALARAFYQSAQEARHQDHQPRIVLAAYEAALHADPNYVPVLRDCAFLLATCSDASMRNGAKARLRAQRACEMSAHRDHSCLVSLATALAECGDFSAAIKCQQQALKLLPEGQSDHELAARLKLYESGRHLHTDRVEPLVAWWPVVATDAESGYVQDASGHGLQGTLMGDAEIVMDPSRGPVLSLDGQGDWMECAPNARFNFVDEISISIWIKVRTVDRLFPNILTKRYAWGFGKLPFGKMVSFGCGGLDVQSNNVAGILIGRINVEDGRWHHLVGVYNGMTICQYVDGELDASAPGRGRIDLNDESVNLGGHMIKSPICDWNGWMDDVRIYNRALSVTEIKALHNEREPLSQGE